MSSVLVTGASGYVGQKVLRVLAAEAEHHSALIATDVRAPARRLAGVTYEHADVRSEAIHALLERHAVEAVVHLATIVTPTPGTSREVQYDVDVRGTDNVLSACLKARVRRLVVVSSGAAYGYHADQRPLLDEDAPLRGNESFAYAHHKRLVEERLARARAEHPELAQLVLRPGTILGEGARNQITALFTRPVVVGLRESETPFSFVWDEDVARVIARGVREGWTGVYNLSGEGVMTLREIAARLDKPFVGLPAAAVARGIGVLFRLGLTPYGPEQTAFLLHRPVLSSARLRAERGVRFLPSRDVFQLWARAEVRSSNGPSTRAPRDAEVVIVTGGAGGIGLATARRFASEGASVALLDRDVERARGEAARLVGEGRRAMAVPCDVCDERACEAAVDAVVSAWGGVDVLVANAGVAHRSLFRDTSPAVLRRVMEVNYFGAVNITRAALPSLTARRGTIAVLSSVAGFAPLLGRTGYAASKHALHGFFDTLRAELEPVGVRVTLVCPSFTDTAIDRNALGADGGPAPSAKRVVGRLATPEEVAEALVVGVRAGRRRVLPTAVSRGAWWLSRLAPAAYERVMRRAQHEVGTVNTEFNRHHRSPGEPTGP